MHTLLLFALVASSSAFLDSLLRPFQLDNCTSDQFPCKNGRCIPSKLRCNEKDDCHDGSDEMDCDLHLCKKPQYFRCKNGRCIASMFVCDQENDCEDYSDEAECEYFKMSHRINSTCESGHWQCTDRLCIPNEWVCDGEPHCLDESDEGIGCSAQIDCDTFKCKNGHCVPNEWICDGKDDCHDRSDEEDCENHVPLSQCNLDYNKFLCSNNRTCIDRHKVCDGHSDCPDKSDESALCSLVTLSCSTHGCSHQCIQLPTGPKCICPSGYHNAEEKKCEDINECEQYGICGQKCRNTPGSYECYCDRRYTLNDDKKTCKANGGEGLLIFSSKTEIRGLNLESEIYMPLARNLKQVVGIDYDGDHIYWTEIVVEHETIVRSDGTNHEVLVTAGLGTPEDLAVDWLTGNIYFTDVEYKHIGVCTNDGSHCTVLINRDIRKPRGIALDIGNGKMYWTDWGDPAEIATSLMDGTNDEPFVKDDVHWPNGLTLDLSNERLYWTDAKKMSIESIRWDGTDRRVVLDGIVMHPYSIAIFENKLYWSDWHTKSIESCDKFTGKEHHTIVREQRELLIYGIHIFHPVLHQRLDNPCKLAYCSDICLLRGTSGYTCACPQNKRLSPDRHTCKETGSKSYIIIGAQNLLYNVEHQLLGKHDVTTLPAVAKEITSLAYDSTHNVLFVSDGSIKKIITLDLDTGISKHLDITGFGEIIAMDFDPMGNNLYICDGDKKILEVINLNTLSRKILIYDLNREIPESIALVPNEGVMFVALRDVDENKGHVDQFNMDGTGRIHTSLEDLSGTISLHYDNDLHRIFIAASGSGIIESTSIEGDDSHNFRTLTTNPVGITTLSDHLFWVTENSKRLYWAEKKSANDLNKKITLELPDNTEKLHIVSITNKGKFSNQCSVNNNNCTHLCLMSKKAVVCACPTGWNLLADMKTCTKRNHCDKDEYFCSESNSCILRSLRCNGHQDCSFGEDEKECEPVQKCPDGQFQCHNGDCIKSDLVCDHNFDCKDKSDEQQCEKINNPSCKSTEFMCESGKCVPSNLLCDGSDDCGDSSDEQNCESKTCLESQFRCDSGTCIPLGWECDNEYDCPDFSDEHALCVSKTCPPTSFTCSNGKCIDRGMICDNVDDCGDNSDEHACFIQALGNCELDEFPCSTNTSICLHNSASCNGTKECPHGEDEQNCANCDDIEYMCDNRRCIPLQWTCDGFDDCGDNSDENADCASMNYSLTSTTRAPIIYETCENGYRCNSGQCIDLQSVCDSKFDCYDGSDEGGLCAEACTARKNPCSQQCNKTPHGPSCSCNTGYHLKGDGSICIDLDECEIDPPMCSQLCYNREGDYDCDCFDGFLLRSDRKSCKAEGDPMSLIFSTEGQLRELTQKTNKLTILYTASMPKITSLDNTFEPRSVYFSIEQPPSIHHIDLKTRKRNYLMDRDIGQPQKIAVDWSTHNVYYYNAVPGDKSISICNLEGVSCAKLLNIDIHRQVSAMAIDSVNKVLFYALSNWWMFSSPTYLLYKVNLDGTENEVIVPASSGYITGLTFDHNKKLLYYINGHSGQITAINYEGKHTTLLYSNITRSVGLKFFENYLYYFTTGGYMVKCRLYDRLRCDNFKVHSYSSDVFTIIHQSLQPKLENVCSNHTCKNVCVPSGLFYKCLCEDGKLRSPDHKCSSSEKDSRSEKLKVHSVSLDGSNFEDHSGTITLSVLIPILVIILGLVAYYVIKKRTNNGLNISMRFHNPVYQGKTEDEKPILQPGLHEYINPVLTKDSNDSELTLDIKNHEDV